MPYPGVPEVNPKDDLNNATEPRSRTIGVIIPPPEIRKIADKTAEYVAKNGSAFEEIVQRSEANNPKFSFLKPNDPYRAYFEEKVIEFAKGGAPEKEEPRPEPTVAPIVQKKDIKKEIRRDIRPPPADKFTVQPNTSITALDMDVIKLTAQFVAKKGQKFLIALTEREKQNPQFDFLKPTHQLFSFFMNLLDAYSKCSNPSKSDVMRLQQFAEDRMAVLNAAGERFEFEQQQSQLKKTKDDREDEERVQMAQIDWNEFVVVETIDLFDDEALPAPSNFSKPEVKPLIGPDADAFRTQPSATPSGALPQAQPFQKPAETVSAASDVKVKRDYVRPSAQGDSLMNKCPNCGQYIPVSEFNEHLRIEMLDPKYKEIKADVQARAQNTTMSSGDDIAQNLKNLARNMPSVLGSMDSGRDDSVRGGAAPKLIWDGQSGSMTRTTANQAMIAQQQKRNYDEQMRVIQDIDLGDIRRPGAQMGMQSTIGASVNRTPAGPHLPQDIAKGLAKPVHEKQDLGGHEGTKKVRTEEAGLLPEEMWLEMNAGNIALNISVPNIEEEGIQSKLLQVQFDPRTTIQAVKEQLSGMLGGLPAAKMRLKTNNLSVLKDEKTLAYYNLLNGTVMDLGLKERGGRNH